MRSRGEVVRLWMARFCDGSRRAALTTVLMMAGFAASSVHAARFHYMDVDGTLVHDSGRSRDGKLPAFWTYWNMVRIDDVGGGFALSHLNTLERDGKLPRQVLITTHEYDLYRDRFARGHGQPNRFESVELLADPLGARGLDGWTGGARPSEFYPGLYWRNDDIAFQYHRTGAAGEQHFVHQLRDAMARTAADPEHYEWRGHAFPYFREILKRQDKNERLYLLTMRDPDQLEIEDALMLMFKREEIPDPRFLAEGRARFPTVESMTNSRGLLYGRRTELVMRKGNKLRERVAHAARSTLARHQTLSPDLNEARSGRKLFLHEVIFYENDPDLMAATLNQLRALAGEFPSVKIVLNYANVDENKVRAAEFNYGVEKPSRWVIFTPSGKGWRQPLPVEQRELEFRGTSRLTRDASCAETVAVDAPAAPREENL